MPVTGSLSFGRPLISGNSPAKRCSKRSGMSLRFIFEMSSLPSRTTLPPDSLWQMRTARSAKRILRLTERKSPARKTSTTESSSTLPPLLSSLLRSRGGNPATCQPVCDCSKPGDALDESKLRLASHRNLSILVLKIRERSLSWLRQKSTQNTGKLPSLLSQS